MIPVLRPQTRPAPSPEASLEHATETASASYHLALLERAPADRVTALYDAWQALVEQRIALTDPVRGGAA